MSKFIEIDGELIELSQKGVWWCAYCERLNCFGTALTESEAIEAIKLPIESAKLCEIN